MVNADENIQDPYNTQNYNKYGYVFNNPLMFNDPSGEWIVESAFLSAVIIGAMVASFSYTIMTSISGQDWDLGGFFKSTLFGAASAAVTYGIGSVFVTSAGTATQIATELGKLGTVFVQGTAHALAQGVMSLMQGQDFGSSFVSGFLGSMGASAFSAVAGKFANSTVGIISSGAVFGGVGSELTGGNFWQGAVIGGFVAGFNHVAHLAAKNITSKNILAGYLVKNKINPYDPATAKSLKAIIALFTSPGQWVEVADPTTLADWSKGYLPATIDSNQLVDLIISGKPSNNPSWGITNPVNGKIILAPRLLNGIEDNFWVASVVIHEQDHFTNFTLGIFQGNSYIEQELNELSAYRAAEKWTGIMEKQGFVHMNNVISYFLKFSNH